MKPEDFLRDKADWSPQKKLACLVKVLTGPDGCAWDQKQTPQTIIDFVIDEAHELKSALHSNESSEITGEVGDLLFTVQFLLHGLADQVSSSDAVEHLVEKMVRRHPHVFADTEFQDEAALKLNWEREKRKENRGRVRFDQDIPASLPPLQKTKKVLARASNVGFRYERQEDAWDKIWEEIHELEAATDDQDFESELGDLMVALLTLARMRGVDAVNGLERATRKLCDRLQAAEVEAGRPIQEIPYHHLKDAYLKGKQRQEKDSAYFNHCGVSPWPRPVRVGVQRAVQAVCRNGLAATLKLREEREGLRGELRRFVGAPEDASVVFVPNISTAASGVAHCFPWSKGDRILLGRGEFPANTIPWKTAAQLFDLNILWWNEDSLRTSLDDGLSQLENLLENERPRLVALSAVSFWSGFRYPVETVCRLCHKYGARLFVDSIQALGVVPLEMGEIDYLAGGSHKVMLSPEGSGFLLVAREAADDWTPRVGSWLSLPEPVDFLLSGEHDRLPVEKTPRPGDPTILESGSSNSLGYAGLKEAVKYLSGRDLREDLQRIQRLQDPLEAELQALGWSSLRASHPEHRSAILSFVPPERLDLVEFCHALSARGVSIGIPNGRLRFGFHHLNDESDVDFALKVIHEISKAG